MNIVVEVLGVEIPALAIVWGFGMLFLVALFVAIHFDTKDQACRFDIPPKIGRPPLCPPSTFIYDDLKKPPNFI